MQLNKVFVSTFALITNIFLAGLIETSNPEESRLVEATVNILESCYLKRIGTVGLAGASAGIISKALSLRKFVTPVTLVDDTSRIINNGPVTRISRYKLQVFVVTVINSSSLAKTLIHIKKSIWWNHMASFLLLDWSMPKHGCTDAYEMLWVTWKMNILNSKVICIHGTRGSLIYTYNPYTNKAPIPWQLSNIYRAKNDHNWSLFVKVHRKDEEICDILDFDKTTDLGGHEIRASVQGSETWWYADPKKKPTIFNLAQNISAQLLISSLNATWKFRLHPESDSRLMDKKGKPSGEIGDVLDGISDIGLNFRAQHTIINYTTVDAHFSVTFVVITQYRGNMSQLEKICSLLDRSSRFGLLLVSLITLLFFKYYLHKPLTPAILDLVLIVSNAALLKVAKTLGPRLYLGSLFLFVLTIQGIYQGKLASLLTKQKSLPNINTIEDLSRFDYTIYGHAIYYPYFNVSGLEGRYIRLNKFNCTGYVLRDPKAACTYDKLTLISEAAKFKLHLSNDMTMRTYGFYTIRSDWPLEERLKKIFRRSYESNLLEHTLAREVHSTLHIIKSHESEENNQKSKVLILRDLSFGFVFLGIGLGIATAIFIIELGIDRLKLADA